LIGLEISDDGVGRQHDNKEGYGLLGLRERVTLLGGSLEAGDKPHGGFRLFVSIPYDKQISGQTHE
jgi:signal transduction histidine kinase